MEKRQCDGCRWFTKPPDDESDAPLRMDDDGDDGGECRAGPPRLFIRKVLTGEPSEEPYTFETCWPGVQSDDSCASWTPIEPTPKVCSTCRLWRPEPAHVTEGDPAAGVCCGPLPDPTVEEGEPARPVMDAYDTCAGWEPRPEFQVFGQLAATQ